MPLPRLVARLNKRCTNRFIEPVVRRTPGYVVVRHVGRRSGHSYRTPLYSFLGTNALFVALTYGPDADWVQNVLAGGGTIIRDRHEFTIEKTTVVDRATAWPFLPGVVRIGLRILRVNEFAMLELHEPGPA